MAMVQVDLSEYDMLREAKNKAEGEVKELKETLKGLKDKSRVMLQTKYKNFPININKLASDLSNITSRFNCVPFNYMKNIIEDNLHSYITEFNGEYESCQYIGFEDVRVKVEAHYKKEIDKTIADYEDSKERYYRLSNSVEEEVKERYSNAIDKLKEDNRLLIEKYEKSIENKDAEIKSLKDKITELSKSKEDKIAELEATIKEAEAKLRDIAGVKKGFFNKIFR